MPKDLVQLKDVIDILPIIAALQKLQSFKSLRAEGHPKSSLSEIKLFIQTYYSEIKGNKLNKMIELFAELDREATDIFNEEATKSIKRKRGK